MLRASSSFRLTSAVLRCISRPTSDVFHRRCNRNLAQNRATSPPRSLHRRNPSTCSENVAHNGVSPTLLGGLDTDLKERERRIWLVSAYFSSDGNDFVGSTIS